MTSWIPARRWKSCASTCPRPMSPPSMPSRRGANRSTPSSPRSARTRGSSFPGTWHCNMSNPIAEPDRMNRPPSTTATFAPPVMEARRWLDGVRFPDHRPLINVSQAAPVDPPPELLRREIAQAAMDRPEAHLYGPVLGLPDLREEVARQWSAAYRGEIGAQNVAITSGCNQAFCAAIAALCREGDEVLLPTPWYFNHKMWLDMSGVAAVPLPTGAGLLPDPDEAARLITPRTRAIVLVT